MTKLKNLNQNLLAIRDLFLSDNFSFDVATLMINHETTANDWIAKQIGSPFLCERDGTTALWHTFLFYFLFAQNQHLFYCFAWIIFAPEQAPRHIKINVRMILQTEKIGLVLLRNPTTEKCRPYFHSAQWFKGL